MVFLQGLMPSVNISGISPSLISVPLNTCTWYSTGKHDLTQRVTHREADFGTVIHSIFDAWHYDVLWTCKLTRLL